MKLSMRFLQPTDLDKILTLERSLLKQQASEEEAMFAEWHASWRQESLEFYLPNGWCFGIFDESESLTAYFLAQPILFFHGLMQTLWVEHLTAANDELKQRLLEVAYKTSREKHLQKLLVKHACLQSKDLTSYSYKERADLYFELTTTKMDNP